MSEKEIQEISGEEMPESSPPEEEPKKKRGCLVKVAGAAAILFGIMILFALIPTDSESSSNDSGTGREVKTEQVSLEPTAVPESGSTAAENVEETEEYKGSDEIESSTDPSVTEKEQVELEDQSIAPSIEEIFANVEDMTDAQRNKYMESLRGARVEGWRGKVTDVNEGEFLGGFTVYVEASRRGFGSEIFFDVTEDIALSLNKGQEIKFSGDIEFASDILGTSIHLENVIINAEPQEDKSTYAGPYLGDAATRGGVILTALNVIDPASGEFYEPVDNHKLVGVEIIINNQRDDIVSVNPLNATIIDSAGFPYDAVLGVDNQIATTVLGPKQKIKGVIGFQIPDESEPVNIKYYTENTGNITAGLVNPPEGHATAQVAEWSTSDDQENKLGDIVKENGFSLSAITVEDPTATDEFYEQKPGYKLVAVEIIVGNESGDLLAVNPLNASMVDNEGFVYPVELGGRSGGEQIATIDLAAGEKVKGWVAFEIPENATPQSIRYQVETFPEDFLLVGLKDTNDSKLKTANDDPDAVTSPKQADETNDDTQVGSRENPVPIGQPHSVNYDGINYELTVLEAIRGDEAWNKAYAAHSWTDSPLEGWEYVLVKAQVTYIDDDRGTLDINYFDLGIVSGGAIYDGMDSPEVALGIEPAFDFEILPGGSAEGWFGWQVPISEENPILYPDNLGGDLFFQLFD